jgi:hypothetical protein
VIGALVIAWPGRFARGVLVILATAPLAALLFFHPASLFTALWSLGFAAALLLMALLIPPSWLPAVQLFLGLEIGLNAIRDVATALLLTSSDAPVRTDATVMATALFLRPVVWAALWAALSALVLVGAVWKVARRALYSP